MAPIVYLSALLSTALRIAGYLFLRVIPSGYLRKALPTLYILHLSSLYLVPDVPSQRKQEISTNQELKIERQKTGPAGSQRSMSVVPTVLFSLPSSARALTFVNVAINTIVLLLALDLVLYPLLDDAKDVAFTRVGAVYPDAAKLVVRYPTPNATQSEVRILWRQTAENDEASWNAGPTVSLDAEDDWVGTVRLDGLWPSTSYEYVLGDVDYVPLPYPPRPIHFRTFPDPRLDTGSHFRFVASSCLTPNFPYVPFRGRQIRGFDLLADYLWSQEAERTAFVEQPDDSEISEASRVTSTAAREQAVGKTEKIKTEFMILLGDFIYADVPLYFGDNVESYRRLYRRNYQSDSFRKVYERLPIIHTYDDHEIKNNFAGQGNDSIAPFANADNAFRLYNANGNYGSLELDQHYYDFRYADTAFFVMDTRRYRSDITKVNAASRTMLGDKQLFVLHDWLAKVNNTATFKFIVTSVPFTSLWQHDAQKDSWAAYPNEKAALLSALHTVKNVILLSGDRHEFAAIKFNSEGHGHNVLEVSTSPLSMFYIPFIRTLHMASETVVKTIRAFEGGGLKAFQEEVPREQVLQYIAEGNHKWSSFEVDTRDPERPIVHLEVMVDGKLAYKLAIAGKPVERTTPTALGMVVQTGVKGILDRMGLNPSRWF